MRQPRNLHLVLFYFVTCPERLQRTPRKFWHDDFTANNYYCMLYRLSIWNPNTIIGSLIRIVSREQSLRQSVLTDCALWFSEGSGKLSRQQNTQLLLLLKYSLSISDLAHV